MSALLVAAAACADNDAARPGTSPGANSDVSTTRVECTEPFVVLSALPRTEPGFTQGLAFLDGALYESTGRYGESAIRQLDRTTFAVVDQVVLPADRFGEGLTALGGSLYQLTWREEVGYVWGPDLSTRGTFTYAGEGWGLTTDGTSLIRSDGSNRLVWTDPTTMLDTRELLVFDGDGPVTELNELEWVDGMILANVWQTDTVVVIDPADGRVLARLDLADLRPEATLADPNAVLNGIAFDPQTGALLVTGKRWPVMYEVAIDLDCWR